jgi:peptidoglycan/xylan/chitin deacetylase (PgdA/CDA1 family)
MRRSVCILTFHRVLDERERDHDVTTRSFRALLTDLHDARRHDTVLTFDDGTADHLWVAEELASRGLSGFFFITSGKLGSPGYLAEPDLASLVALGHAIGSHGASHVRLERLDRAELRHELRASRNRLNVLTGAEITAFAAPGGSRHPQLEAELVRSGYTASRSMRWGVHHGDAEEFDLPCIPVTELTIARGWVLDAVARGQLPWTMRGIYRAKTLLPERAQAAARRRSHRRAGL